MSSVLKAELQLPQWEYEDLIQFRSVNFIMPLFTAQAQALHWGAMVRIQSLSAQAWDAVVNREPLPSGEGPLDSAWWDVVATRDCELGTVHTREWADNFGPQNLSTWVQLHKPRSLRSPVRVSNLRRVLPELDEFNREYGQELRRQGR